MHWTVFCVAETSMQFGIDMTWWLEPDEKSTLVQMIYVILMQQVITWTNVDPVMCRYMASLGHNELMTHWCEKSISMRAVLPAM